MTHSGIPSNLKAAGEHDAAQSDDVIGATDGPFHAGLAEPDGRDASAGNEPRPFEALG